MNESCKNCGHTDLKVLYRAPAFDKSILQSIDEYDLARCQYCSVVNTLGVDSKTVSNAYSREYYGSSSNKFVSVIEAILSRHAISRAKRILRYWNRGNTETIIPSVLDIGCGRGQLLSAFRTLDAKVLGLERQEFPLDEELGNNIRIGAISDPEYIDRRFDIIILWHVLEHLNSMSTYYLKL